MSSIEVQWINTGHGFTLINSGKTPRNMAAFGGNEFIPESLEESSGRLTNITMYDWDEPYPAPTWSLSRSDTLTLTKR